MKIPFSFLFLIGFFLISSCGPIKLKEKKFYSLEQETTVCGAEVIFDYRQMRSVCNAMDHRDRLSFQHCKEEAEGFLQKHPDVHCRLKAEDPYAVFLSEHTLNKEFKNYAPRGPCGHEVLLHYHEANSSCPDELFQTSLKGVSSEFRRNQCKYQLGNFLRRYPGIYCDTSYQKDHPTFLISEERIRQKISSLH